MKRDAIVIVTDRKGRKVAVPVKASSALEALRKAMARDERKEGSRKKR